jgi:flavin reductase (DIM6/NTAB) family NADH-FMN oxidoreductase RutF/nitroreductase
LLPSYVCTQVGAQKLGYHGEFDLVSSDLFKSVMRNIASSVAVITTNHAGKRHGMTATAVCSVSSDPATVLVVINRSTRSHPLISASKTFTINILADHQHGISGRFSAKHDDQFEGIGHREGSSGNPVIDDVAAYIECSVVSEIDVGTHTVFIGHVIGGNVSPALPLLYHEGEYKSLSPRTTERDVASMFLDRWSPRAFDDSEISDELLMSFFEAARWAPSSMNAQPWRFIYAKRGGSGWQSFLDALSSTNRSWASKAAALVAFVSKVTMSYDGAEIASPTHSFDTGAAWMSFALQASLSGWHTHGMAGFDAAAMKTALLIPEGFRVDAAAAIGKLGDSTHLPEHLKAREIPSTRNSLADIVFNGAFGNR